MNIGRWTRDELYESTQATVKVAPGPNIVLAHVDA
jgi:hypothetical protein